MTNKRLIEDALHVLADENHYLFSTADLRSLLPGASHGAFRSLIHRLSRDGVLTQLAKDLFLFPRASHDSGNLLFHAAAKLRDEHFNYLSLETVLSREGLISQVPLQWISLMSSGRSYQLACKGYGTIEFVHTKRTPSTCSQHLTYDPALRLWVASTWLAMQDMKRTHRTLELVENHGPL